MSNADVKEGSNLFSSNAISSVGEQPPEPTALDQDVAIGTEKSETGYASDFSQDLDEFRQILFPQDGDDCSRKLGAEDFVYLNKLGSQGLESLMGEVARVNEELAIIEHQTRDMASQNYQIFVQSAQTTNSIKKSLLEAKTSVEDLTAKAFPECKSVAESFVKEEGPLSQFQNQVTQIENLAEKKTELMKVLDMPWVIRRCLANGDDKFLSDAIKILHIIMEFKKNTTPEETPPVLASTISSVLDLQTQIQNALLQKLQSPTIGLSDCLQTVQLLRNFFSSDVALRFRFLQSRMNHQIEFENSRSWIFDTLTQHRAAFGQDSKHYLSTFIALQLTRVLSDLQKRLEHQNLDSLFLNANYFGESLARVGADLRALAVPLFSEFICKKTSHELLQAELNFMKNLQQYTISTSTIRQQEEESEDISNGGGANNIENESSLQPPMQLLNFSPLAIYCNEVLGLLNAVGKCPIPQTLEIVRKLNGSVRKVGDELEAWGQSEWLTWETREQHFFNRMRRAFEQQLVPHIDKALKAIYPLSSVAAVTGMNVAKCAELVQVRYSRISHANEAIAQAES